MWGERLFSRVLGDYSGVEAPVALGQGLPMDEERRAVLRAEAAKYIGERNTPPQDTVTPAATLAQDLTAVQTAAVRRQELLKFGYGNR